MINAVARDVFRIFNVNKFIETGIREGDTLNIVTSWFCDMYGTKFITEKRKHGDSPKTDCNIYEIDNDQWAIDNAARLRQHNENIISILGDSPTTLSRLVDEKAFLPTDSCFFYLDAHTAGVSEPLTSEIGSLKKLDFPFIISIDDWNVASMNYAGYEDFYGVGTIRDSISDRTDVIYETSIPNVHSKMSCYIFMGYKRVHLSPLLRGLPLIETPI